MNKLYKIVRILTIPPILAAFLFLTLGGFGIMEWVDALLGILFIGILPVLSYPLQPVLPYFKHKGREGQRNLAIIFSVLGYILGCVLALCFGAPKDTVLFIYLDYLISGVLIALFNKVFKLRASGHACGLVGPVAMILYFSITRAHYYMLIPAGVGLLLTVPVFISSIKMKRHTFPQLLGGSAITVGALLFLCIFF